MDVQRRRLVMSRPPPQPIFVHRGFSGGAVSCAVVRTANVDDEQRSITSVGILDDSIWIHVRNYAVIILTASDSPQTTLHLSHCGFCMASVIGPWLVYPDTINGKHYLKFWSRNFNNRKPVVLKDLPLVLVSADDVMFVGDEAGTLSQISSEEDSQKQVRLFSEPVFSMACSSSILACGSSKPPILMLAVDDILREQRKIYYPQTSQGVGSMAFSTSGKTLITGFWDGSIRAFSTRKLTVLLYLDFHKQTIPQLLWEKVNGEDMIIVVSKDEKLSLWKL
ncbi:hypothetical protein DICVIV_00167 [Dictyocaulus viviparus]|uniref:Uncharacterized protein n=1 Tax=Dictyocaulus viviparus TaxID=29172 RepID=A0A0D8YA97_DICVI|nr:hypothetical protein DICVIV_00167 [Dictyocaulus viviparus]